MKFLEFLSHDGYVLKMLMYGNEVEWHKVNEEDIKEIEKNLSSKSGLTHDEVLTRIESKFGQRIRYSPSIRLTNGNKVLL